MGVQTTNHHFRWFQVTFNRLGSAAVLVKTRKNEQGLKLLISRNNNFIIYIYILYYPLSFVCSFLSHLDEWIVARSVCVCACANASKRGVFSSLNLLLCFINCYFSHQSLFFVSIKIVTGPSFNSDTFISAPNSPVNISFPKSVCN